AGFGMLSSTQAVTTAVPSGLSSTEAVTRQASYYGNFLATFTEGTNRNGNQWTRGFDAATRTWTIRSPAGRSSTLVVDEKGRQKKFVVPNITPTTFAYDAHGRVTSVSQGSNQWTWDYDAHGYLTSLTDPLQHATVYVNDAIGRPTQTTLPGESPFTTDYD